MSDKVWAGLTRADECQPVSIKMCESEVTTLVGQGREYIKEMTKSVIAQLSCTMKLIS